MKALCGMIHEVDPAIPIYSSTWHHQPEWDGCVTVWGFGHFGVVPVEKQRQIRRDGATLWWTTYGQMCIDTSRAERILGKAQDLVTIPNAGGLQSTRILPDPDAVFGVKESAARAIEELR